MIIPFRKPYNADFPPEVLKAFGAGMHGDDMVVPWHDRSGELVATLIRGPSEIRGWNDHWDSDKPVVLYNLHRIKSDAIVLTQDVYDVWYAYMGHHEAAAFHGRWVSGFADDLEEAGIRFVSLWMPYSPDMLAELAHRFFVRYVEIPVRTERHWNGGAVL